MQHDATKYLASDDEDDVELGQDMQEVYEGLKIIIPRYFPHKSHHEQTLLCHRGISLMNTLVDSNGDLTSIVDWECVAAVPTWQACDLPQLLQGRPYALTDLPPTLDNNADPDSVRYYKENLAKYELAQLRTFFLEEMQRLSPEWMDTFRRERLHLDIVLALEKAGNDTTVTWVKAWLKALLQAEVPKTSLKDGCRSGEVRQNADWIWE